MKKVIFSAVAVLALVSCSNDSLVSDSPANEAPIAFNVGQKNITRTVTTSKLEDKGYLNFGVWANKYKASDSKTGDPVMIHYLVGFNNASKGYAKSEATTGTWFYEGLGKEYSYSGATPYVTSSVSVNDHQYLRYWDLSYNNTKFFAYAPYNEDVAFAESNDGSKKITVPVTVNVASNTNDFIYAGKDMANSTHENVPLQFKHLGAKVMLRFYEDISGYKVKLIDVVENDGSGKPAGIQATPTADKKNKSDYYTAYEAVIDFSSNITEPSVNPSDLNDDTKTEKTQANLKFTIPGSGDGVVEYPKGSKTYVLPEVSSTQTYATSPTVYYAVAQPSSSSTGFTFHVSFELIAEDNGEIIKVNDARVYVPAEVAKWQPSTQYIYTFKITKDTNGSTSGETTDITTPTIPTTPGLYPIIFENVTIEEYTEVPNAKDI